MIINNDNHNKISLHGDWSCLLDDENIGVNDGWYQNIIDGKRFKMPGTTNENSLGQKLDVSALQGKELVKCLRQDYKYVGAAWYQKEFEIPNSWNGKRVKLFLERVMFESRVWIDEYEVGKFDSLSIPHSYDITRFIECGKTHRITIRIDNSDIQNIGPNPSAYTDETQTIWNGIIGEIDIYACEQLQIRDVKIFPDIQHNKVTIRLTSDNHFDHIKKVHLTIDALSENTNKKHYTPIKGYDLAVPVGTNNYEIEYDMGDDVLFWDEFNPAIYTLGLSLQIKDIKTSEYKINFGMKEFKVSDNRFTINGNHVFLRGTLECCIFPLTGYPPTNISEWMKLFKIVKEYGLNHVRFHSWCPPEEAFNAADQLGIYLQIEGPVWMDTWCGCEVGSHPDHYTYLFEEELRIINTYGNHPSFCLFSNGNELNGDFTLLHDIIERLKKLDNRFVYTLTSNWDRPIDSADDFFIAQTVDGKGIRGQYYHNEMVNGSYIDYHDILKSRNVPIVSHEVGQYCVYPNVDEVKKYTGVLRPINLEWIKKDLASKNMLHKASSFVKGSGKLAATLYKDELEAALRTEEFGGIQLLDLHDFPGQSTATIGLLDAFWDTKGILSPEEFRSFCSPSVLLLRFDKRVWQNDELFNASVEISHFGHANLNESKVQWLIESTNGKVVANGMLDCQEIPIGGITKLGNIANISLANITKATCLKITLKVEGTSIYNSWNIWVYPVLQHDEQALIVQNNIMITDIMDKEVKNHLHKGGKLLLLPKENRLRNWIKGNFFPVFWSPVHFASEDTCGIITQNEHPVFNEFPTDCYSSYQWKELLENSVTLKINDFPLEFDPIVECIPNFYNNNRLTNLFEAKVGNGKLIVCTMDLENDLDKRITAKHLRNSLLNYMASDNFIPQQQLEIEDVLNLFLKDNGTKKISSLIGVDIAKGKPASSDSTLDEDHGATKGNDGISYTKWCAGDDSTGHWWQVDLGDISDITGTRIKFEKEENYLYVIKTSVDGIDWKLVVNQTGQTSKEQVRVDAFIESARYVRVIYNGLPSGVSASHYSFEVYSK